MKTMIEKVAQASWEIWRKSKEDEGDPRATMFTFDHAWNGPEREFCIAHARACIKAMREPTQEMVVKGKQCCMDECTDQYGVGKTYAAMIDAALS